MKVIVLIFTLIAPTVAQTTPDKLAESMLARRGIDWDGPLPKSPHNPCTQRIPAQMDLYATVEWTHHCPDTRDGIVREAFFYVFGEPVRIAKLRIGIRPLDESPRVTTNVLASLRERLTKRFGTPDHGPALMEIGFRSLRYGQPVAGDHWKNGSLHYFLHANQSNESPMGMRRGVQLVVMHNRLMQERAKDEFILRVEGLGGYPNPDDPIRTRLTSEVGIPYTRAISFQWKTPGDREQGARQIYRDLIALLRDGGGSSKPMRLLAADTLVSKLSVLLIESPPGGEREAAEADSMRRTLVGYGVKLGHMTHYGGLAYGHDLLRRVWREFPDTEAGELAFLQGGGWNTYYGEGCPKNPDLFREVITQGEAFLAKRPQTPFRKEVLYSLAVANESWWSIAHAAPNDPFVSAPPYPRRNANAAEAGGARERAMQYYKEVVRIAPQSAQAASALRRLPRLELGLDTGQRAYFCSYC